MHGGEASAIERQPGGGEAWCETTAYRTEPLAKAAGVAWQKYIMAKPEDKGFTVVPGIRAYKMLRDKMRPVYQELRKLRDRSQMDEQLVSKVELLADLFIGMTVGAPSVLEIEDAMIDEMKRGWERENPLLLFPAFAFSILTSPFSRIIISAALNVNSRSSSTASLLSPMSCTPLP